MALLITCVFISLTFFLKNVFRYLAMYFIIPVRSSIVNDLRQGIYDSYVNMSYGDRGNAQKGDLITRMLTDVQEVENSILKFIHTLFKSPIIIIGSVLLMITINPELTLFVFVLMIFTGFVIGTLSKTLKKQSLGLQEKQAQITTQVEESIDGYLHLNVFRVKKKWAQIFNATIVAHKNIFDKVTRRQELSSPLSEFLGVTVVVLLLGYGSLLVFDNRLRPEAFFAFVLAFYHVIEPLKSFSTAFYNIRKGSASLERIDQISSLNKVEDIQPQLLTEFIFDNSIRFENVSFSYGSSLVLDEVSLIINKGEKTAIVGSSGSGKSTIILLLLKFIKPTGGTIWIDEIPFDMIDKQSWYKKLGVVTQEPFLFNGTIRDNLLLKGEKVADIHLLSCLNDAGLTSQSQQQDKFLDQQVGDRGVQLSGGEGQRLTIARALVHDPELLIFDEPTSALDPEAEQLVGKVLMDASTDRTSVIVAHRLSTIKEADKIVVLESGKVVEEGNHTSLSVANGKYAEYINMQLINR